MFKGHISQITHPKYLYSVTSQDHTPLGQSNTVCPKGQVKIYLLITWARKHTKTLGAVHKLRHLFLGCSRPPTSPFVILRHLLAYPPNLYLDDVIYE